MPLLCAFGSPWPCGPCVQCKAYADELRATFERGVFWNLHDAEGFTPAERKAQRKKLDRQVRDGGGVTAPGKARLAVTEGQHLSVVGIGSRVGNPARRHDSILFQPSGTRHSTRRER